MIGAARRFFRNRYGYAWVVLAEHPSGVRFNMDRHKTEGDARRQAEYHCPAGFSCRVYNRHAETP